jgi:serine/threonine protein kinase
MVVAGELPSFSYFLYYSEVNQMNPFPIEEVSRLLRDRFRIEEIIRVGGQGVVCRGLRTTSGVEQPGSQAVALKFYLDPSQDVRVEREIKALTGFHHPNLAHLVDHGRVVVHGKTIRFVAWEYVEGEALDQRLMRGPLPARLVACVGRDIARAIEHIWTKRIVHRDVNPKNIMLRRSEEVAILIDLGVARHLSETPITSEGLTWGTIGYLSPEQCRAETNLTCSSDIFSLGVVLQEALSACHPTGGDQKILVALPKKTSYLMSTAPAGLADIIDSMLCLRAAFRPHPHALAIRLAELTAEL